MAVSTNLIQIEEFEMQAGLTDIYYTTTGGLDNSLIGIYNDHYGVYPVNVEITGSGVNQGLHITYEAQTFDMNVAVLFIKGDLTINNTLTSNSETEALSAKQGKILKDLIDAIQITGNLSDLNDVDLTSLTGGDILVYDAINQKWINTALPTIPSDIADLDDVTITSPTNGQALIYNNGDWINGDVSGGGGVDYSTSETDTGLKWIDNKSVYRKVIDIGSLPNSTTKYIPHGITGIDTLIHAEILTSNNAKDTFFPVPYTVIGSPYINYQTNFILTDTDIGIECGTDRSAFSGYAILEYTKQ